MNFLSVSPEQFPETRKTNVLGTTNRAPGSLGSNMPKQQVDCRQEWITALESKSDRLHTEIAKTEERYEAEVTQRWELLRLHQLEKDGLQAELLKRSHPIQGLNLQAGHQRRRTLERCLAKRAVTVARSCLKKENTGELRG